MSVMLPVVYMALNGNTAWTSHEHNLSRSVIRIWNDDHHVAA